MKPLLFILLASVWMGCTQDAKQPRRTDTRTYFLMPDTLGPFVKKHSVRKDFAMSDSLNYVFIDSTYYVLWDSSTIVRKKVSPIKGVIPNKWKFNDQSIIINGDNNGEIIQRN